MGQSLAQNYVHIVFATVERQCFLADDDLRQRSHAYIAEIARIKTRRQSSLAARPTISTFCAGWENKRL
jgi:hypothetical protein